MKKNKSLIIGIIITTLILVIGTSYAFFTLTLKSEKELSVTTGTFKVDYKDKNTIFLDNLYPMSDQKGMMSPIYEFSIENTGDIKALYDISLEEEENSNLNDTWLKYSLKRNEEEWSDPRKLTSLKLEEGFELGPDEKDTYQLRLWIDESVGNEAQGKVFIAKVVVNSVQSNAKTKDIIPPVITLNGSLSESVEQEETYIDPGVESVVDDHDELSVSDIKLSYKYFDGKETVEVENVDTTQVGVYYIYYKIKDTSGNEGVIVRSVNVYKKDTTPPVIRLNGKDKVAIEKDSHYEELGATASKNEEDLTSRIVTVGTVNTKRIGTYEIKYLITDQEGNTASIVRFVNVVYINESSINDIRIDLNVNTKEKIHIEGENLGEVTYTSSDEGIVSVDSAGNIEGHELGEAIIKVVTSTGVEKEVRVTVVKIVTVTYVKQGSGVTSIEKTSDTCEIKASGGSCEITTPSISVSSGYTAVGWNRDKEATDGTAVNSKITLNENVTYYSISYKNAITYTVNFNANGNIIGATSKNCTIPAAYNEESQATSCSLTTPVITAPSATPIVVGYHQTQSATSAQVGSNVSLNVTSSINGKTYYAITKNSVVTRSITYTKSSGVGSIGKASDSCSIKETYNGASQGTSCSVTLPTITSSAGYNTGFWSTSSTATSGSAAGTKINLSANTTYYARALDTTKPVWSLAGTSPSSGAVASSDTLTIKFNGTDTSGSVISTLSKDYLRVKIGTSYVQPTSLSSTSVTNGKQYTLTIKGINVEGRVSLTILANTLKDSSGNSNIETTFTTNVTMYIPASDTLIKKANSNSFTDGATAEQLKNPFTVIQTAGAQQSGWSTAQLTDYRYMGANPNNYVTFNGMNWRIIGVFTVEDENGKKEQRLKLIFQDNSMFASGLWSFNNQNDSGWANGAAKQVLNNGAFYNRTKGTCPYGGNAATKECDFSKTGLTADAKSMIGKTKWYLGGWNSYEISTKQFYIYERSNHVYSGRPTNWIGEVGLMYPSDYGYAAGTKSCHAANIHVYSSSCCKVDWLHSIHFAGTSLEYGDAIWTMTPNIAHPEVLFFKAKTGTVGNAGAIYKESSIQPVVFLKRNVSITGGVGSNSDPYTLKLNQ